MEGESLAAEWTSGWEWTAPGPEPAGRERDRGRGGRDSWKSQPGAQATAAVADGAQTCTYITLQLLLRGGLAEPSRANHFAAAHGARREGSRTRHRRGRWTPWTRSRHDGHTQPRGRLRFPRRGGPAPRALCRRSNLSPTDPRTKEELDREPR